MSRVTCFFDGACPGNQFGTKGPMRAAYVIGDEEFVRSVPDLQTPDGPMRSNNIAEYFGLISLLRNLRTLHDQGNSRPAYLVLGDSELVVQQMRGKYRVRAPHLRDLHMEATELASGLDIEFRQVSRSKNRAGFLLER